LPCAIDTSIWRSSVTICSALNLFLGMTSPFLRFVMGHPDFAASKVNTHLIGDLLSQMLSRTAA
jgi:hypothetical protein